MVFDLHLLELRSGKNSQIEKIVYDRLQKKEREQQMKDHQTLLLKWKVGWKGCDERRAQEIRGGGCERLQCRVGVLGY